MENNFDFVIIGGDSVAFSAAKASEADLKIALIERSAIGGTCVNVGCVPTRNHLNVGERLECCDNAKEIDFRKIIQDKDNIVLDQRSRKYQDVLKSMPNVEHIQGQTKFRSNNEIEIDGRVLTGKNILISTGSSPTIPPIDGIKEIDFLTNSEIKS